MLLVMVPMGPFHDRGRTSGGMVGRAEWFGTRRDILPKNNFLRSDCLHSSAALLKLRLLDAHRRDLAWHVPPIGLLEPVAMSSAAQSDALCWILRPTEKSS